MASTDCLPVPERTVIGGTLEIPRMINGLWQLAGGHDQNVDISAAAQAMDPLISSGLDAFDMADHYGDAELVVGRRHSSSDAKITAFTKWCPAENGDKSFENAEAAVDLALSRMQSKKLALLQYHIWDYTDDTYLHNLDHLQKLKHQGKIDNIGLTNTDAAHLELLLDSGFDIATNQVSCSLIDRRAATGPLARVCSKHGVKILAYGTLLGGYLSEKWLDQPEPSDMESLNWSLRKYLRFIRAAGGWNAFQTVLKAAAQIAAKHNVPIAAVATRYVLDVPNVAAVIVGTRLSSESSKYTASNLAAFSLKLDEEDMSLIYEAQKVLRDIPGDGGDEYRRPPYLTASGDLSHHLSKSESGRQAEVRNAIAEGRRVEYLSGSKWEPIAGYCRAVRTNNTIGVSGTTANSPIASTPVVGGSAAGSQAVHILDIIARALKALDSSLSDVVRTRIMIRHESDCEAVSRAHGWVFKCSGVSPANTLVTAGLIGDEFLVEIEAEAEVGMGERLIVNV